LFFLVPLFFLLATASKAEITRIEVTSEAPFAGGKSFGATGPYVRVSGRFHGELDPSNPGNKGIVDIRHAPRNARGRVEYSADFDLLRPADPFKGNGTLLYEANNRGNKLILRQLNAAPQSNALDTAESAGDGFLMRHGFTLAWSGWIPGNGRSFPPAANVLRLEVPNAPGLEQPVWDEFLFNDARQREGRLSFTPVTLDKGRATLTVRDRNDDTPSTVQREAWEYTGESGFVAIRLLPRGTPFRAGALYQFTYRAKNPPVAGIGFAATRDWVAFLRYAQKDGTGKLNPLGPDGRHKVAVALGLGVSQAGRYLRDFLHQGFNETEDLRMVFDGINPEVAAARIFLNFRFAQPNRNYTQGFGFLGYPDAAFPFAYEKQRDWLSRREDGLLERCRARGACPKVVHTVSSTEYWQGAHSLNTADAKAENDLALPDNVRIYHFAGAQHVASQTNPPGVCGAAPNLAVDTRPALRALILALDRWVKGDAPPPASVYPKLADGTLVPAASLTWPTIPGFAAPRTPNPMLQFDYGYKVAEGLIDIVPPVPLAYRYKVLVPKVDADGNELAGLRLPEQAVPAATTTGWSLRSAEGGGAGELCGNDGSAFPFAKTAAEREAAKDPRPSLAERYENRNAFLSKIRTAAQELVKRGFYLEEDVEKTVERASKAW
jgi:hypothetical protein